MHATWLMWKKPNHLTRCIFYFSCIYIDLLSDFCVHSKAKKRISLQFEKQKKKDKLSFTIPLTCRFPIDLIWKRFFPLFAGSALPAVYWWWQRRIEFTFLQLLQFWHKSINAVMKFRAGITKIIFLPKKEPVQHNFK